MILRSLAVFTLLVATLPAMAGEAIGVMPFSSTLDAAAADRMDISANMPTHGIPAMLMGDLFRLLANDPDFAGCDATLVEMLRRKDVIKEQELQQGEEFDPATRVVPNMGEPTVLINGVVSATADGIGWTVDVTRADGSAIASVTGHAAADGILDMSEPLAREILEKLCKPKAVHIKAGLNDLQIDQDVCDITKPFTLRGQGATAGLVLTLTPSSTEGTAGSYELSGMAGGVTWSGGGSYAITLEDGSGGITMDGSATIATPRGTFSDATPISGIVTALKACEG